MVFDYKPKLTEEQYDKYMASYHGLIRDRRAGELSQSSYLIKRNQLDIYLHSRMNPQDMRFFSKIEELQEVLVQIMPFEIAEGDIVHELQHGKKAQELGYGVQYGLWLMQGNSRKLVVVPFTHTLGTPSSSDLDQIRNAPERLSVLDRL